ncbi:hypothetical protein C9374_010894 [Naegleria lovaniensis]|uniref:Uncharacterized protein n=1 Tax=Naegleria lovaniensis TaxID=51637 RepID=A0AA88GGT7_NAELO|nr:uncharacterized protein C9374_010894 [Naegleria lovaniensis]KAG2374324.1 hypothetical protein C9374_010894 [Naegleria lovaniensis]
MPTTTTSQHSSSQQQQPFIRDGMNQQQQAQHIFSEEEEEEDIDEEYSEDEEETSIEDSSLIEDSTTAEMVLRKKFWANFERKKGTPVDSDIYLIIDEVNDKRVDLDLYIQQLDKIKCIKRYTPYTVVVHQATNINVPHEEIKKYGEHSITVDYRLSGTLFHTHTKTWLSRTFYGPYVGRNFVKQVKKDHQKIQETVEFEMPLFFYSNIVDESVVLVVEVITAFRQKSTIIHEFSSAWTILRIFKETKYGKSIDTIPNLMSYVNDENFNVSRECFTFEGTPRVLSFVAEPLEDQLTKKTYTKISYSFFTHPELKTSGAVNYFRPNDIVSQKDFIPGIKFNSSKYITDLVNPRLSDDFQANIVDIQFTLPIQFEQKILSYMKEQRRKEHGEYVNNEKEVSLVKRVLSIGSHNTFTYIQGPSESTLVPVKNDMSGEVASLKLDNNFSFKVVKQELCAIIFEIHYIFEVPLPLGEFKRSFMDKLTGSNKNKKTVPEIDFTTHSVSVGYCLFFPNFKKFGKIEQEIICAPGLSFLGKPIFKASNLVTEQQQDQKFTLQFNYFSISNGDVEEKIVKEEKKKLVKQQSLKDEIQNTSPPPKDDVGVNSYPSVEEDVAVIPSCPSEPQPIEEPTIIAPPEITEDVLHNQQLPSTPKNNKEQSDYVLEQLSSPGSDLDALSAPAIHHYHEEKIELGRSRDLTKEIKQLMNSLKFNVVEDMNGRRLLSDGKEISVDNNMELQSHNMYINFLSFIPKKSHNIPKSIYFKFQFFTFSQTDTSKTPLYLVEPTSFEENEVYALSLKTQNDYNGNYGLQLKFTLDPSTVTEEEYSKFLSYLHNDSLFINIFDNESRFSYGVFRIPLALFMRDPSETSVQQTREYDVIESLESIITDEGFTEELKGTHLGKIVVTVSNVGKPAESQINKFVKAKQKYEATSRKKKSDGPTLSLYDQYNFLTSLKEPSFKEIEQMNNQQLIEYCSVKLQKVMEYRNKEKTNVILHNIEEMLTSHKVIYASFGELEYFEIPFKNMYTKDHAFTVEIEQKELSLSMIVDEGERLLLSEFQQDWKCIQLQSQGSYAYRFSLQSNAQTQLPFKFQSFSDMGENSNVEEMRVVVKNSSGSILKIIKIRVVPRSFVIHQNFEFYHPVTETVGRVSYKKKVKYSLTEFGHEHLHAANIFVKTNGNVYASTSSYANNSSFISIDLKSTLVNNTKSSGHVLIFGDQYFHRLIEIWKVVIIPVQTFTFDAFIGQTNYSEFHIPKLSLSSDAYVRCEKIDNEHIDCSVEDEILHAKFTTELNSERGTIYSMFHILETTNSVTKLLARYFFKINLQQQTPSKSYNHMIPINSTEKLKLSFVNAEPRTIDYTISSNHPELLRFKVEQVTLAPGQRHVIYMKFFPCFTIGSQEILLYINRKEDNQTVKCLGINVKYQ